MENPKFSILGSQAKKIVHNVLQYFQKEKELGRPITSLEKVHKRVAEACGISERRIQRIPREGRASIEEIGSPSFKSPIKQRKPRSKTVTQLDDFQNDIMRRTVLEFYEGIFSKLENIHERIQEKNEFQGSISSLWRALKDVGFKYKRTVDGRKFLMERGDVVTARIAFLRKMRNLKNSGGSRQIFYLEETWVNQNYSLSAAWVGPNEEGGLKVPIGKGSRIIICHVGSAETGFLEECELVFRSKGKKNEDYHSNMNAAVFTKWFEKFLEALKVRNIKNALIVIDNASYHSVVVDKSPTTSTRKEDIRNWLILKGVPFTSDQTTAELLALVQAFKPATKNYELDRKDAAEGHTVVRLPPYHCQYNPIELVWSQVKRHVAENNSAFKMNDLEIAREDVLEPIIVQLGEDDEEDDSQPLACPL